MRIVVSLLFVLSTPLFASAELAMVEEAVSSTVPSQSSPELIVPEAGHAYGGAYIDFGDGEDNVTRAAIDGFDKLVGKKQAIIGFSSDWGMQSFPHEQMAVIKKYGAVALIYWSPWDRPFGAPRAQNRFHLKRILAGEWDAYIDAWANAARDFGDPIFVAWGLEMNGQWFPWSGAFYGAGTPVGDPSKKKYQGPEIFKETYRYVVDRVRKAGAKNILWVFHANNTSDPNESWNEMASYYPGPEYVDWLGMSAYGMQYPDQKWPAFELVLPKPYKELTQLDPAMPIILAEWGIGEFPYAGDKAAWLEEAFSRIPAEHPRIKAAVYWHEQWKNGDGKMSNIRVNSSEAALSVFRKGIASSYWLDRPILK